MVREKESVPGFHWFVFFVMVGACFVFGYGIRYHADRIVSAIETHQCTPPPHPESEE